MILIWIFIMKYNCSESDLNQLSKMSVASLSKNTCTFKYFESRDFSKNDKNFMKIHIFRKLISEYHWNFEKKFGGRIIILLRVFWSFDKSIIFLFVLLHWIRRRYPLPSLSIPSCFYRKNINREYTEIVLYPARPRSYRARIRDRIDVNVRSWSIYISK